MAFYFKRENNMSSKIVLTKYLSATKEYTEERIKEIKNIINSLKNKDDKYIILNALNCSFYKELIYIMNQRNL